MAIIKTNSTFTDGKKVASEEFVNNSFLKKSGDIIQDYSKKLITLTNGNINLSQGNVFYIKPTSNINFTFSNFKTGAHEFVLYIETDRFDLYSLSFPSNVKFESTFNQNLNKIYKLFCISLNNGNSIHIYNIIQSPTYITYITKNLYAWGDNSNGILGTGDTTQRLTPTQIGTDSDWTHISTYSHSLGIRGGKLYAWGHNKYGKLGTGDTTQRLTPTQIGTDSNWTYVSAGSNHSIGIRDGKLYGWGYNEYGQLGTGDTTQRLIPTQIGTDSDWTYISAGDRHSLGIRDGKLYVWGFNRHGLLGDGTTQRLTPTQIGTDSDWTHVSTGGRHSFGIRGGKLYGWGLNENGQLGDGTTRQRITPTQIGTDSNWVCISTTINTTSGDRYTTLGINNGRLYGWGYNDGRILGDGTTTQRTSPIQIGLDSNWTDISIGTNHATGINNGKFYAWGDNSNGILGTGDTSNKTTPTQIGTDSNWVKCSSGYNLSITGIKDETIYYD